jgi:hypothetical protein
MHVQRDGYQLAGQTFDQRIPLLISAELEKLLGKIVAKSVRHELAKVWEYLREDHVTVFRIVLFELLLEESAAVLVFAQGRHVYNEKLSEQDPKKKT